MRLLNAVAAALFFAVAPAFAAAICSLAPTIVPTVNPLFYGTAVVAPWVAQAKQPGVMWLQLSNSATSSIAPAIAKGYQYYGGAGYYEIACIQGDIAPGNGCSSYPNSAAAIAAAKSDMDAQVALGATLIYIDEPTPNNISDWNPAHAWSAGYVVAGGNALTTYLNTNHPGVKLVITLSWSACCGDGTFKSFFDHGANWGGISVEDYEVTCCFTPTDFAVFHAAYPTVLRFKLDESIKTMCADSDFVLNGDADFYGLWDSDNFGGWGYPSMDPLALEMLTHFAATGDKSQYCNQTESEDPNYSWNTITPSSGATRTTRDGSYPGQTSPYTISSCDYRVFSGPQANAAQGIVLYQGTYYVDPGMTLTRNWTTRTCNSTVTLTLSAGGDCRNIGTLTCLVEYRNHNNSSGGLGNSTYYQYSISYP